MSPTGRSAPDRGDRAFLFALVLVALLPRLYVAIAWSREPVWDGHYYHFGAERIAAGLGYSEDVWVNGALEWKPWVHYPVGYSALLGGIYRIFGTSLLVAPLLNVLLGVLATALTFWIARRGLDATRARVAGSLVALHPGLIAQSALVMTELLTAMLLALLGLIAVSSVEYRKRAALFGLALGAAALVRPSSLLVLPLLVLARPEGFRRAISGLVLAGTVALLVIAPWTLRNCARLDGCALVSTNGGWNLAIGAITETGRFRVLRAEDGCPVVTGQVQQDRCWAKVGVSKILEAPGRWLARAPLKLAETFNHESFPIEYLHEANPKSWPEERRVAGRGLLTLYHRLLLVVAALGAVAWPFSKGRGSVVQGVLLAVVVALALFGFTNDAHPFYLLAVFVPLAAWLPWPGRPESSPATRFAVGLVLVTLLTHVIFFGEDRYHLVISPLLCLLAAAALRPEHRVHREAHARPAAASPAEPSFVPSAPVPTPAGEVTPQ
ncbi:MAG: glycosyltransferase family 39 protein [Pseudomonadota bacterium]